MRMRNLITQNQGLMYFKPPSNLRDNFLPYFEVNLHFFLDNQLLCSYLYYT